MKTALDTAIDAIIAQITAAGGPLAVADASVSGVTLPVFTAAPGSMRDFFAYFAQVHGASEFLVHGEDRLTFAQVHADGLRIAAMLQHRHGIAKGDRVAIAMRNYPEWISAFIGIMHLGAVAVPMNAWWTAEELDYGLRDCGARLAIADETRARRIATAACALKVLTVRTAADVATGLGLLRLEDEVAASPPACWYLAPILPEDDATIMYTSGSTGTPKGGVSTQRGIIAATMNYLVTGLALLSIAQQQGVAQPPQQAMLLNLPLFHITGLVPVMLVSVASGRKLVIMDKWEPSEALRLIEKERCTYFIGVPTMSLELMSHPDRDNYDTSSLIDMASGGAPRPPEHVARLVRDMPGKNPLQGYGLTETNGVGAGNLRENYVAKPNSTGRASAPMVQIRIVAADAPDCSTALPQGETGEVCLRSAANMRGYWMNPHATAEAFPGDSWFRSGDLGYLDADDYLFIVDRKKDIIIRGGENISCQEVEAALYAHPAVAEASVFGLPDDRLGEITGAVVYAKPDTPLEADALIDFVSQHLASFKIPARLWLSPDPLPKLGSGKIDKVSLRAQYRAVVSG
ncbi:class I adenylate-forming enzyme family protein [Polymorphobacter sp.]|uniref:class I adenylate-forming enzyme family protein n=1 Tax=Polymorphobacter sp. TaxID=1909290 RepID=UPI003F727EE8